MGSSIKELLLGIPVLCFIFWVFIAPLPGDRIERVCEPINWAGNLMTSGSALASASHTETAVRWSDKMDYSCKYMVWRLFYQEAYNKAVAAGQIKPAPGSTQAQDAPEADKTTTLPREGEQVAAPASSPAASSGAGQ